MRKVPFSPGRVLLIAQNTLREATRQKLFGFMLLFALGLVLGARWFRDFNFGAPELKFLADCGLGAMAFFGAALTIAATSQLFFSELENSTLHTLLAKPVWRAEFILGKFFGVVALVGAFCVLLTALLAAVLWWRQGELMLEFPDAFGPGGGISWAGIATAGLLQWLKFAVLASLTLLVATFAQTQLFTVIMGFFVLVVCHLQYLAQDTYVRSSSWIGRALGGVMVSVFPNFQLFALADASALTGAPPWSHVARVAIYSLGYSTAACALAIYSFRQREIR